MRAAQAGVQCSPGNQQGYGVSAGLVIAHAAAQHKQAVAWPGWGPMHRACQVVRDSRLASILAILCFSSWILRHFMLLMYSRQQHI